MSKISSIRVTRNTTNNSLYSVSNITVAITLEDAPFGECPTAFDCYVFADDYYPIDGRKLSGKPSQRGMYINKGKKILVK